MMNELEFAEIRLGFYLKNDFKTRDDAKKVGEALNVVLAGDYNNITVEKALLTLRTRIHRSNSCLNLEDHPESESHIFWGVHDE